LRDRRLAGISAFHGVVRICQFAVKTARCWLGRTYIGDVSSKGFLAMSKTIPTLAAALLMTAFASQAFAQAAIQEPGAFAFYHPNADVLNAGRPVVRSFDANAYYGEGVVARETQPRSGAAVSRHHHKR
jgi:hypothetical protein